MLVKRSFDLAFALLGLTVAMPLLCLIAMWIKIGSPGPVFYRGERVGRFGKPFRIYKFRTMVADAEKIGGSSTMDDDPRTTKVGSFLRRHKLDELPQLFNILNGEMSFVGPRPQVLWAVKCYSEEESVLLSVRPGVTDPASIKFHNEGEILRGSSDPDKTYYEKIHPEKVQLSLDYIQNWSILGDIKIIFQTMRSFL